MMASVSTQMSEWHDYLFEELGDPRVKTYFLMSSPYQIILLVGFYYYFVFKLGPSWMKNRPPFELKWAMVVYNGLQILACFYLVQKYARYNLMRYSLICEPVDYSNEEFPVDVAWHVWLYMLLKLFDLLDTVFFVLRKKNNQVTVLHVYHHTAMCVLGWIGTKYVAGGHGTFIGFLNCIVHLVMYFYYLLSAWDNNYIERIWWKKYVTRLQIIQFVIFTIHSGQVLFQPNCGYPKLAILAFLPNNLLVMGLFINYYVRAYMMDRSKLAPKHNKVVPESIINHSKKYV